MKNWTKWYKQTLDKAREKNKAENEKIEGMTEREQATWNMLMKQYGLTEDAIAKTQSELKKAQTKNFEKTRANEVSRTLDKSKVRESVNRDGINNVDAENMQKQIIDQKYDKTKDNLKTQKQKNEDELTSNLRSRINDIEEYTANQVKSIDKKYDKLSEEKYDYLKKRIDYLLNYNDTGTGDIFYDIKDNLLSLIEQNKENLSEKRYNELKSYVNSKIFINSGSDTKNVTFYVNDKELVMTSREFEWSTKITFSTTNFVGMVYGELIKVQYEGDSYKVKVGTMAQTEDVNVVKAIAKRKKISIEVGTCITYNKKIYMYSGDGVWRTLMERGGLNYNDGLAGLIERYEEDIYKDAHKGEEE